MGKRKRFKWKGTTERSIAELVSEDGTLRTDMIYKITRRLCMLLESPGNNTVRRRICPSAILVDEYGYVRFVERECSPAEIMPYLPPEQNSTDQTSQSDKVFALGMLMLYMATGQVKKTEAEISLDNTGLLSIIRRCTAFDPMNRYEDISDLHNAVKRESRVFGKVGPVLLYILLAAVIAGSVYAAWQTGAVNGAEAGDKAGYEPGYADGYKRGYYVAPGIGVNAASVSEKNGSLSGNFSSENGPTAAYSDQYAFFLRNGDIIRMDSYTGQTLRLKEKSGAYSLQYYQDALYCCTPESILRIDPDTGKEEMFCESRGGMFYIFEDVFYLYESANTKYLYRISKNGKEMTQLSGAAEYLCLNIVDGKLYYIDPCQGNGICSSDPDGGNMKVISSSSYESFCIYDGKLYAGTAYGLIRMDLNGGNPEMLTTMPAYYPNASDSGVFFVSGSGRTLEWISSDGRERYTVVASRTASFQVAGQWIIYENEDDGGRLWTVRVSGADNGRAAQ